MAFQVPNDLPPHISFAPDPQRDSLHKGGIYIPGPREREGKCVSYIHKPELTR
jgi:preprotein translocase subunit SecY